MFKNTFGIILKLTTFGESHGTAVGGILDGFPAGIPIDIDYIQKQLDRRRPGQSALTFPRNEADKVELLSGVFEGKTLGTPIGFIVKNTNAQSRDYESLQDVYRPSHADFTYQEKYGFRDYRGGGRSSARETVSRVVGGAIAAHLNHLQNIKIWAYVSSVGQVALTEPYHTFNPDDVEKNPVRCPHTKTAEKMIEVIETARKQGDSVGGVITGVIQNVPAGLGEPVFAKLHAALGYAMLGINAVKGFEYGSGFYSSTLKGSEHNDIFFTDENGKIKTRTNHSGGIQGGISNGMDIYFRVAFKPVATVFLEQETINEKGEKQIIKPEGRHDPCVVPRAVPIVEAMAHLVIADFLLLSKVSQISMHS